MQIIIALGLLIFGAAVVVAGAVYEGGTECHSPDETAPAPSSAR